MAKKKTMSVEEPFLPGVPDNGCPKEKTLNFKVNLKCKNTKQKEFFNILKDRSKEIVFGVGSAGAGKTYVAMSEALCELRDGLCDKIIFVTPPRKQEVQQQELAFSLVRLRRRLPRMWRTCGTLSRRY